MKPSYVIVGCGKLGTNLARHLAAQNYPCAGVASKSIESAKQLAQIVKTDRFGTNPCEFTKSAAVTFITTPDGAIEKACQELSEHNGFGPTSIVLHCSGAHPSTILSAAKQNGALIGSMHPLQSFASKDLKGNPFKDIIMSVEGDLDAVALAQDIASDLGARHITIRTEAKVLYHASAVVASNYLVTLMDLSFKLIETAGISGKDAFDVLGPLVKGTLNNIEKIGIPEALTGPISRGDVDTIAQHVKDISEQKPELLALYNLLGRHTVDIAKAKGTLSDQAAKEIVDIVKSNDVK